MFLTSPYIDQAIALTTLSMSPSLQRRNAASIEPKALLRPNPRMYYVPVRTLPQSVLAYIRRQGLIHAGDRVGVAVSGGADSVALLRIMLELRSELGVVLSVVHFNHQLRGDEADTDELFVTQLALQHKLELFAGKRRRGCLRPQSPPQHGGGCSSTSLPIFPAAV